MCTTCTVIQSTIHGAKQWSNCENKGTSWPLVNGNFRIQLMEVRKHTIFLAIFCGSPGTAEQASTPSFSTCAWNLEISFSNRWIQAFPCCFLASWFSCDKASVSYWPPAAESKVIWTHWSEVRGCTWLPFTFCITACSTRPSSPCVTVYKVGRFLGISGGAKPRHSGQCSSHEPWTKPTWSRISPEKIGLKNRPYIYILYIYIYDRYLQSIGSWPAWPLI